MRSNEEILLSNFLTEDMEIMDKSVLKQEFDTIEELAKSYNSITEHSLPDILNAMKEAQIEVLNEVDRKCTEHGMWSYCDKMMIQKLKEELK
jgi:hypothetical protein